MSTAPPPPHGHRQQRGHKEHQLRSLLLPDSRRVYIALSQEEAESLRQRLRVVVDEPFELVIYGSESHLCALRCAYNHYEERLEELKRTNREAYDGFESLQAELDVLGSELHTLTDHAISLDANFSKYGYSAHIKSYDTGPSRNTPSSSGFHDESRDWELEKRKGKVLKIYKKVPIFNHIIIARRAPILCGRTTENMPRVYW